MPDISKITKALDMFQPEGIQKLLDDQVARIPGADRFILFVRYVPQGQRPPEGTTHTLELVSAATQQKIQIAVAARQPYAGLLDMLLAVL